MSSRAAEFIERFGDDPQKWATYLDQVTQANFEGVQLRMARILALEASLRLTEAVLKRMRAAFEAAYGEEAPPIEDFADAFELIVEQAAAWHRHENGGV